MHTSLHGVEMIFDVSPTVNFLKGEKFYGKEKYCFIQIYIRYLIDPS